MKNDCEIVTLVCTNPLHRVRRGLAHPFKRSVHWRAGRKQQQQYKKGGCRQKLVDQMRARAQPPKNPTTPTPKKTIALPLAASFLLRVLLLLPLLPLPLVHHQTSAAAAACAVFRQRAVQHLLCEQ